MSYLYYERHAKPGCRVGQGADILMMTFRTIAVDGYHRIRKGFLSCAEICKTLSNPVRLRIINELQDGEITVGTLAKRLSIRQAHLSQHLSVLRQRGVVATRKDGLNVYTICPKTKIIKACQLIRDVLMEHLQKDQSILTSISDMK